MKHLLVCVLVIYYEEFIGVCFGGDIYYEEFIGIFGDDIL